MTTPEPTICINVDVTNPGQFFACCGLLELASRLDQNATAHFENGQFLITGDVQTVLDCFFNCDVKVDMAAVIKSDDDASEADEKDAVNPHRGRTYPMTLGDPFNLRLDWWNDEEAQRQKLKIWTAGQHVTDLLLGYHKKQKRRGQTVLTRIPSMRDHFAEAVNRCPDDWLREPWPIGVPSPFSYDSRLSRNSALDLGHTEFGILAFSPAVEVLTLVGLQRFRPRMLEPWTRNRYCTWNQPLPVEVAAVAALGLMPHLNGAYFEFPIKPRDAQGRYKLFGHAQPVRSSYV
jgi:CRISPR-associated protein Csb3